MDERTTAQCPGWIRRNMSSLVVLACILFVGFMQWPMVKGMVYRATGSAPEDRIKWRTDYAAALVEARESGKPILLDFSASWCPPCQTMKHEVWPDKAVEELANGRFIPVLIDVDIEQMTPNRFDVSSIPTVIALGPGGEVINRSGFMSASGMVDFMNESLAKAGASEAAMD